MTTLTKNEKAVLVAMMGGFNYDTPAAEKDDNAVAMDVTDLAKATGMLVKSTRGVVGSLTKKGMVCETWGGEMGDVKYVGITDAGIDRAYVLDATGPAPVATPEKAKAPKKAAPKKAKAGASVAAIEVFYDSEAKAWTTLAYDANENQIGDAQYDAKRAAAQYEAANTARELELEGFTLYNTSGKRVEFTFTAKGMKKEVVAAA